MIKKSKVEPETTERTTKEIFKKGLTNYTSKVEK